jgi:hypothetical protein
MDARGRRWLGVARVARCMSGGTATVLCVRPVRRIVDLGVKLDGCRVQSETTCMWAGAYVLTVATVLPDRGLAFELVSSFVGHRDVATHVTHLALGPPGRAAEISAHDHAHESLDPMIRARECAYEHVQVLLEQLTSFGHDVSIEVPDDAFDELERIEG